MNSMLYLKLSAMMFLQYAIWGAWAPVLAARLLGPLKMNGKQTGWIYATLPLACIVMPLIAGQVADRWVNTEFILAGVHLVGAVLLFISSKKESFSGLFVVMLLYALCYAASLPLVNSLMFHQLAANNLDVNKYSPGIFIWAPIAWSLVGYLLTGWRWKFKTAEKGRDCLVLASVLSLFMAISCWFLPETLPAKSGGTPLLIALGLLKEPVFLIFIIISLVAAGTMQFYFLGTAQFMQDLKISGKNVPAAMAVAQALQAVATWWLLGRLVNPETGLGFKWTLGLGLGCWLAMYVIYAGMKSRWLIVVSQALHGLAYVFFIIAGQMFANSIAPAEIRGSVQALIFTATTGIGLFLGTRIASLAMDRFRKEDQFQWRSIFLIPGSVMLGCVLALLLLFKG